MTIPKKAQLNGTARNSSNPWTKMIRNKTIVDINYLLLLSIFCFHIQSLGAAYHITFLTQRQEVITVSPVSVSYFGDHRISKGSWLELLGSYEVVLDNFSEVCSERCFLLLPTAETYGSLLPETPRDICGPQQRCWRCHMSGIRHWVSLSKAAGKCCLSAFWLGCSKHHEVIQGEKVILNWI